MAERWLMMVFAMALLAGGAAAQEAPELEAPEAKQSYALGMAMGGKLRTESIMVDADHYVQGFRDALSGGDTRLTAAEARSVINDLQRELRLRRTVHQHGTSAKTELKPPSAPVGLTGIDVSFKLDPRLTKSLYMGDRWVSPPTFTYASPPQGEELAIEVRAHGLDARGGRIDISPEWKPANTELLQVAPAQGHEVKLIALQEGQSSLTVYYGELSKELTVKVMYGDGGPRVDISQ